ncbi:MAG: phage protein [Anaerocolumna sp.]|jgi:uncharacterized phage protein (TIGR01671 family)|nr:phage protein [Anaerocolumna sp.]
MRKIRFKAVTPRGIVDIQRIDIMKGAYYWDKYDGEMWIDIARFPLMQYSDFQDQNVKDIYEGYIVEVEVNGNKFNAEIICEHGTFMLATEGTEIIDNFEYSEYDNVIPLINIYSKQETEEDFIDCIKIIGNIYENPELLEES